MAEEWSVWKDCCYAGDVILPDQDGKLRRYRFTQSDLRQMRRDNPKKIQAGWNIPLCWEHQNVEPSKVQLSQGEKDRNFALGVFGRIADFDLTPDGRLKALLKGKDPNDYKQLEKIGFVSPEIAKDWRDSDGHVWRGLTVTHLAATPRPVQPHQNPIGTNPDVIPKQLAGRMADAVRMSFAPSVGHRLRLSLENFRYRGSQMAGGTGATETPDATGDPIPPSEGAGDKKMTWMQRIANALVDHFNVDLGDCSECKDPEQFAHVVEVALANFKAGSQPPEGYDEEQTDEEQVPGEDEAQTGDLEQTPPGATTPPTPPVQMSLTAAEQAQVDRLSAMTKTEYLGRVDRLMKTGRISGAEQEDQKKKVNTVRLSFNQKTWEPEKSHILIEIESCEKRRAGSANPLVRKVPGKTTTQPAKKPGKIPLSIRGNEVKGATKLEPSKYQEQGEADSDAVANRILHLAGVGQDGKVD